MPQAGDVGGGTKNPRINVPRSLSDVIKDVERIVEKAERALEELYTIEWALQQHKAVPVGPGPEPPVPAGPAPVAHNCRLEVQEKGRATVTFAEGKQVSLPPALAVLTAILVSGEGGSPDELVAWKSLEGIGQLLEERLRRTYNRHAVLQLLSRLRAVFRDAGFDPRLIESAAPLGARLRLKRRPASLCVA